MGERGDRRAGQRKTKIGGDISGVENEACVRSDGACVRGQIPLPSSLRLEQILHMSIRPPARPSSVHPPISRVALSFAYPFEQVCSVTRWIRANFPPKILKFPQFFPTILRIPNLIVKFPKPKKVGFMIPNGLEMVAYGAWALWQSADQIMLRKKVIIYSKFASILLGVSNPVCQF